MTNGFEIVVNGRLITLYTGYRAEEWKGRPAGWYADTSDGHLFEGHASARDALQAAIDALTPPTRAVRVEVLP